MKRLLNIFWMIGLTLPLLAQHGQLHYESFYSELRTADELFGQKKFAMAKKHYALAMNSQNFQPQDPPANEHIRAHYQFARCGIELFNSGADKEMEQFIDAYTDNPYQHFAHFHLARYHYYNRKYGEAISSFEQVNQNQLSLEEIQELNYQLGYAYFAKKKFDKSLKYLSKAKDVENRYFIPANYYYGVLQYKQGDYDAALKAFELVKDAKVYARAVPYYIGHIQYGKGEYDEVIAYFEPLIDNPKVLYKKEMHHLLGVTYYTQKEFEKALPHLQYYHDRVKKVSREDQFQLAYCLYKTGNCEKAAPYFETLNAVESAMGQNAMYLLANCRLEENKKLDARIAYQRAGEMNFDKEIQQQSLLNYGKLSYEMQMDEEALSAFQKYATDYPLAPENGELKRLTLDILLSSRNYKRAYELIQGLPNLNRETKAALKQVAYFRGVEEHQNRQFKEAKKFFQIGLESPGDDKFSALSLFWLGDIALREKQYSRAESAFNKYLNLASGTNPPAEASPTMAYYNLGYIQFFQNNYKTAFAQFTKARRSHNQLGSQGLPSINTKVLPDIALRMGDCQFIQGQYKAAKSEYQTAEKMNALGVDYASFQSAIITGLLNNPDGKIRDLKSFIQRFPESAYLDDAFFEIGDIYYAQERVDQAVDYYLQASKKFTDPEIQKKAALKLGLAYYRKGKLDKAVDYYSQVLDKFPKTVEARESYEALKEIAIEKGSPDIIIPYAGENISEIDSITYFGAEKIYANKDCNRAISKFEDYITNFPSGYFLRNAHFYQAECLYQEESYQRALKGYQFVLSQKESRFSERSRVKAARILFFEIENFQAALPLYDKVARESGVKEWQQEATLGAMRSAWKSENNNLTKFHAQKCLALPNLSETDVAEAHYYLGKIALNEKQNLSAFDHFEKCFVINKAAWGAESKYLMAKMYFDQKLLDKAEDACFSIREETPSQQFWLVKAGILISDILRERKEYFQAKATLKGIMEAHKDEEILRICESKIEEIEKLEAQDSPFEGTEGELEFVEPEETIDKETDQ